MRNTIAIIAAMALGACATPVQIRGSGVEAPPPIGYIVWCAERPAEPLCGGGP